MELGLNPRAMEFILQNYSHGVVVVNKQYQLVWFNRAAKKILGTDLDDQIGHNAVNLFGNDEIFKLIDLQSETQKLFKTEDKTLLFDSYPLFEEDNHCGTVVIFQDVSRYEIIAKELLYCKQLKQQLDAVIDSSYDGFYITDGDANTLLINNAYERITGISAKEVLGRNMKNLVEEGFYSESVTLQVLKTRQICTLRQHLKTGKELLVTGNPVFDENGKISLVVTNVRDVTELAQLWQQLTENRSINKRYQRELEELRQQLFSDSRLIVRDKNMLQVINRAKRVAPTNSTVLILGETGVGKEVIAKFIHRNSHRARGSFVHVNCATIPENLMESELFGYQHGAFTGALKGGKVGLLELADKGTLFLDEVGELPLSMQAKLLHVLQEKEFIPLGGKEPKRVDLRVMAATNRCLKEMVKNKKFREDLYYRLNVIPIEVPPLRDRADDVIALAGHFLNEYNKQYDKKCYFSPQCLQYLRRKTWPGNVRQLKNLIERAVLLSYTNQIEQENLQDDIEESMPYQNNLSLQPLRLAVDELERELISKALKECNSNKKAAIVLGVDLSTLWRKMKKLNIKSIAEKQ